jgi:hypothetical protein
MTAADEAAMVLARDEAAVTLARESAAQVGEVGAMVGATAEWADDQLAGGAPAKWVAAQMIAAARMIAAAARGEAVTAP